MAGPPAAASLTSGARLTARAVSYRGDDDAGFVLPATVFFDETLKVECSPMVLGASDLRCLPALGQVRVWPYFTDAACTVPITEPFAISRGDVHFASDGTRVFAVGARRVVYWAGVARGTCFGPDPAPSDGTAAYTLGAEAPLTSFVGFTRQ